MEEKTKEYSGQTGDEDIDFFLDDEDSVSDDADFFLESGPEYSVQKQRGETPEELFSFLPEELEPETEEEEELEELLQELLQSGYEGIEDMDYEQLEVLQKREQYFKDEQSSIFTFIDNIKELKDKAIEVYATSKATNSGKSDTKLSDNLRAEINLADTAFNRDMQTIAFNVIMETLYRDPDLVTVEYVYDKLKDNPTLVDLSIQFHYSDTIKYLETVIPPLKRNYEIISRKTEMDREARIGTAKFMFQKEIDYVDEFVKAGVENCSFIKQIFKNEKDEFFYKCSSCGKTSVLDSALSSIVAFPVERQRETGNDEKFIFPKPVKCSCGRLHCLLPEDYLDILNIYSKRDKAFSNLVSTSDNYCNGASFIRIEPSLQVISSIMSHVIATTVSSDGSEVPSSAGSNSTAVVSYDNYEFFLAVDQFYKKLDGFDDNSRVEEEEVNSVVDGDAAQFTNVAAETGIAWPPFSKQKADTLTKKEVACYFCECVGVSYKAEKNKALYSLISMLLENWFVRETLPMKKIWLLETQLDLLEKNASLQFVNKEEFFELVSLNSFLGGTVDFEFTADGKQSLFAQLSERIPLLKSKISGLREQREKLITNLENSKDEFSYCKILNISNFKLEDVETFLYGDRIIQFCDYVTDRMIITNHAEEFYKFWSKLRKVPESILNKSLVSGTQVISGSSELKSKLKSSFKKANLDPLLVDLHSLQLDACFKSSFNSFIDVEKVREAYCTGNYFDFCKALLDVNVESDDSLNRSLVTALQAIRSVIGKKAEEIVRAGEPCFYLRDLSEEERIANADFISTMIFDAKIPKRVQGEDALDYCKRVTAYVLHNSDTIVDCYDTSSYFDSVNDYVGELLSGTLIHSIEFEDYGSAVFIITLVSILTQADRIKAANYLGITSQRLNLLNKLIKDYQFTEIDYEEHEACFKILNSVYFSTISSAIDKLQFKFENTILKLSFSLKELCSKFSIVEELEKLASMEGYQTDDEGALIDDKETVTEEMKFYCSKYESVASIF